MEREVVSGVETPAAVLALLSHGQAVSKGVTRVCLLRPATARRHVDTRQVTHHQTVRNALMFLEVLHLALVLFCLLERIKGSQVFPFAGALIFLARI